MSRSRRARRERARLRAVALIGIDGSGKTTQAYRLAQALTAAGTPATYHRNAGGSRWLGRLAQRFGRPDAQRLLGRGGLLAVESVLRWLAIGVALVSCLLTGRTAVMDRYAACQYVSIRAHGGQRWERLARVGYYLFPPPQVTFLLALDPAEAFHRIERRGTDHETMAYLTAADTAYRTLPEFRTFVVVDATRPVDEVARQIQEYLAAWLPAPVPPVLSTVPTPATVPVPPGSPVVPVPPDVPALPVVIPVVAPPASGGPVDEPGAAASDPPRVTVTLPDPGPPARPEPVVPA